MFGVISVEMEALKKENGELKRAIRQLSVEKNRLEDQLYRAFRRCLNAKKRKISRLQTQLQALRTTTTTTDKRSDDNNNPPRSKRARKLPPNVSSDDDEDDGPESDETTVDVDVIYDDGEEDPDADPPLPSTSSTSKAKPTKTTPPAPPVVQVQDNDSGSSTDDEFLNNPLPKGEDNGKLPPPLTKGNEADKDNEEEDISYDLEDLTKDL